MTPKRADELFGHTQDYTEGRISLDELYTWVMDREPWSEAHESTAPAAQLAAAIELAYWELDNGDRDEAFVLNVIQQAALSVQSVAPKV